MTARPRGASAAGAALASRSAARQESKPPDDDSPLRAYRVELTDDLLQRARQWLSDSGALDPTRTNRLDRPLPTVGEVLIDGRVSPEGGDEPSPEQIQERGFQPAALRYFGLTAPSATPWCFSWTGMASAQCAYDTLLAQVSALASAERSGAEPSPRVGTLRERFGLALAHGLDTPAALELLWQVVRESLPCGERRDLLLEFDRVLGLDLASNVAGLTDTLPGGAQRLIDARTVAREQRDWARSDELRDQLAAMDVETRDGPTGSVYQRSSGSP